jgi:hypothetical protein
MLSGRRCGCHVDYHWSHDVFMIVQLHTVYNAFIHLCWLETASCMLIQYGDGIGIVQTSEFQFSSVILLSIAVSYSFVMWDMIHTILLDFQTVGTLA